MSIDTFKYSTVCLQQYNFSPKISGAEALVVELSDLAHYSFMPLEFVGPKLKFCIPYCFEHLPLLPNLLVTQ